MEDTVKRDLKGRFVKGYSNRRGSKHSEETKIKMRKPRSEQGKKNISLAHRHKRPWSSHENNPNWKGDNVSITTLHEYVRRHNPPPELCEFCHEKKRLYLANYTRVYNRDFSNWKYLCCRCHSYYDGFVYNLNVKCSPTSLDSWRSGFAGHH